MKKHREDLWQRIISYGFTLTLLGLLVICVALPDRDFSEMENRNLEGLPGLNPSGVTQGSFMREFEDYGADTVSFRDGFVKWKNSIDLLLGREDNGAAYMGKEGYLFPVEQVDMQQLERNISKVKSFMEGLKEVHRGGGPSVDARIMVVPTSGAILKDKVPENMPDPGQQAQEEVLKQAFGKSYISCWQELSNLEKEYIYYRNDHHWTGLGALAGYDALKRAFEGPEGIERGGEINCRQENRAVLSEDFLGTTYSKFANFFPQPDSLFICREGGVLPESEELKNLKVTCTEADGSEHGWKLYDEKALKTKDKYGVFLGGNKPVIHIENTELKRGAEGRKPGSILLIKDSFANAMVPYMIRDYGDIYLVDLRYYKKPVSELIERQQVDRVVFLYNAQQFSQDRNLVFLK